MWREAGLFATINADDLLANPILNIVVAKYYQFNLLGGHLIEIIQPHLSFTIGKLNENYMKYQGSKNRIAKDILSVILKDERVKNCEYWVEPFVGGANMIDKVKGFKRIGNDINHYLIAMFKELQNGWTPPDYIDEKEYKIAKLQDVIPDFSKGFIGIACSFAGKWFGGYARGGKRNYCLESKKNILKQLPNIQDVDFKSVPYNELEIPKSSIIYCDPPYQGTTKYKDSFDHNKFWVWCDILVENGFVVYVSEYNAPDGWKCVWEKEIISNLDLNTGAKRAVERLFSK